MIIRGLAGWKTAVLQKVGFQNDSAHPGQAEVILIAQFIGLFFAFLGESPILRLLQDVFPNLRVTTTSSTPRPFENILQEVEQLNSVSQRLETLANQNLNVEDALLRISENIRNTATVLEVLALVRDQSKELRKNATEHQPKRFLM